MNKITFDFDPFELANVDPPKDPGQRKKAMEEIADFVKTETLAYIADGESPVSGGPWQRGLSPEYKKRKVAEGGAPFANMELSGDMLDSLDCTVKGKKLSYGIDDPEQAPKADGHNNFSGKSELPTRQFIPKPGQTFKRDIISGIKEIAEDYQDADQG